jgi:hypothetical protein
MAKTVELTEAENLRLDGGANALQDEILLRKCRLAECGIGQDLVEA